MNLKKITVIAGVLWVGIIYSPLAHSQNNRFSKVKNLSANYLSKKDKVKITWNSVSNAGKYRVTIKDSSGAEVKSSKTKKIKKSFNESIFTEGEKYSLIVKVLGTSGNKASKNKKKSYNHSTTADSSVKASITATNSAGRSGMYYLPRNYSIEALPLMVAFHGQDGEGKTMVNAFKDLADEFRFIIIAPESGVSPEGIFTWEISLTPDVMTGDYIHTLDCINEVLAIEHVTIDPALVMAAGHSAGGGVPPYIASQENIFTSFAILHGGVTISSLGDRRIPVWLSTGTDDTLRTPAEMRVHEGRLRLAGFSDITYREFSGGHELGTLEKKELVQWWLG